MGSAAEGRDGHVDGDASGVTGIHTGEQRLDELVGDGGAETGVDEVTDRDVVGLQRTHGLGRQAAAPRCR